VLTMTEAAKFLRVSESWLSRSNVPRVRGLGRPKFLRSQLVAYAEARLSYKITPEVKSA
jgi:hypothetical protein